MLSVCVDPSLYMRSVKPVSFQVNDTVHDTRQCTLFFKIKFILVMCVINRKSFKCQNYCNKVKQVQIFFIIIWLHHRWEAIQFYQKQKAVFNDNFFVYPVGGKTVASLGCILFFHWYIFFYLPLCLLLHYFNSGRNKILWTAIMKPSNLGILPVWNFLHIYLKEITNAMMCVASDWCKKETLQTFSVIIFSAVGNGVSSF